ncbi:MAG: DUF1330 domain-containing protein [Pseudomonadota bacterium]
MAAYMIIIAKIHDRERMLTEYSAPTAELIKTFGGRYLVRSPMVTALEGSLGEGVSVVVSEWPDRAAIDAFWNSPEYAPLKAGRQPFADCEIMIVESPSG